MFSHQMENVLAAVTELTTRRNGEVKRRVENLGEAFDRRTLSALHRRGLIDWKSETVHGTGWAAVAGADRG